MNGDTPATLTIEIDRIGQYRKGDTVRLKLKQGTMIEASSRLHKFCRDYLVTPRFEVFIYEDGTFDVGDAGVYGSGKWTLA